MAYSPVGVGTTANDGTGDPLRTAFTKVNANFVEVYAVTTDADIVALAALSATAGLLSRTGAGAFTARTLTGTSPVQVANGTGASGNPTISVDASTTSASGIVELATTAETITGTDTDRAVTPAGLAGFFANGQIAFPASQNASAGANTLDDYEEFTFTPGMDFGGSSTLVTYGSQIGHGTKVGNLVSGWVQMTLSNNGSGTGVARVTNLAFTSLSGVNYACEVCAISGFSGLTAGVDGYVGASSTVINLRGPSTTGSAALTDTEVGNSANFYAAFTYRA